MLRNTLDDLVRSLKEDGNASTAAVLASNLARIEEDPIPLLWRILNDAGFSQSVKDEALVAAGKILDPEFDRFENGLETHQKWSAKSFSLRSYFPLPFSGYSTISLSPDNRLVGTSHLTTGKIYELATGKPVTLLVGHTDEINDITFSPDGKLVATASKDASVRIWNVATGKNIAVLPHHYVVKNVKYSYDGTILISDQYSTAHPSLAQLDAGFLPYQIKLWDTTNYQEIKTLRQHQDAITELCFSHDGALIGSASLDRTARLWDIQTGRNVALLMGHQDWVNGIAFSPDGKYIGTASSDGTAKIWDREGSVIARMKHESGWISSIAFGFDNRTIGTSSTEGSIKLWQIDDGKVKEIITLKQHSRFIPCKICFSSDGRWMVTSDVGGRIWDLSRILTSSIP